MTPGIRDDRFLKERASPDPLCKNFLNMAVGGALTGRPFHELLYMPADTLPDERQWHAITSATSV